MPKRWLKVDLHTHTREDPKDNIVYSAYELIIKAASLSFEAIAITNHNRLTFNRPLEAFASKYNIFLIPGAEITCSGKHVLLINPPFVPDKNELGLSDLKTLARNDSLIIAPHPYFPGFKSLFEQLDNYYCLFDAIEFSAFYNNFFNPNQKAIEASQKYGRPLVASSDAHNLWQLGTSFTLVEAEKTIEDIVQAIKQGRVKICHQPISLSSMARIMTNFLLADKLKIPLHI